MPRRKSHLEGPIDSFTFIDSCGEECVAEVWQTYPNKGARGAHKRKIRSEVFDKALVWISDQYYFSLKRERHDVTKRSLYNPGFNGELLSEIRKVCVVNKIRISRSTLYEVARDVKKTIKAMDNALAEYLQISNTAEHDTLAV